MRGNFFLEPVGRPIWGTIPACARNTFWLTKCCPVIREHPRQCGENGTRYTEIIKSHGPSPRMRGNPAFVLPQCSQPEDHPRQCEENCVSFVLRTASLGLSPRMRGKPTQSMRSLTQKQDHPHPAGKTLKQYLPVFNISSQAVNGTTINIPYPKPRARPIPWITDR